jgi:hypothetical protein
MNSAVGMEAKKISVMYSIWSELETLGCNISSHPLFYYWHILKTIALCVTVKIYLCVAQCIEDVQEMWSQNFTLN